MQHAAHAAAERGIDGLMLLDARHARESWLRHMRGIMIAVAREVGDLDLASGMPARIIVAISSAAIGTAR